MSTAIDNANSISGYDVSKPPPTSVNSYSVSNYLTTFALPGCIITLAVSMGFTMHMMDSNRYLNPDKSIAAKIKNKVSSYAVMLLLLWVVIYIVTNFLILARVLDMNKAVVNSNLIQNSCDGQPMEGETVRYKMMYEMGKNGNDVRTILISILLSILISIWSAFFLINDTTPLYEYRALICLSGATLLVFTIWYCFRIGNYAKEPYGWYKSSIDYKEKFELIKDFAALLQEKYNKNESIPQSYMKLRYNIVKRIAKHNNMANMKDAFRKFAKSSSTYVAEFFKLSDKDDDAKMILDPLMCKNMFKNYYPIMLYTFLSSKTVFPAVLGDKTKTDIETTVKTSVFNELKTEYDVIKNGQVDAYVGAKRARMFKAIKAARDDESKLDIDSFSISYTNLDSTTTTLTGLNTTRIAENLLAMKENPSTTLFIRYFNSLTLDDVFEFIPWQGEVNKQDVLRKFQRINDTTTIAEDDPNIIYCKVADRIVNDPFFASIKMNASALASAVNHLKDLKYGDPSAFTRESNFVTIAYFFFIFGICFFALFHRIYKSGYVLALILTIIIIFICIVLSSNMFIFP